MKHIYNRYIAMAALCCLAVGIGISCSEEADCSLATRPSFNGYVYTIEEVDGIETVQQVALTSLTVTALHTDSTIINAQTNVTSMQLPLRYAADSTELVLHYADSTEEDTVVFRHDNTPYFLSMDCGFQMKQVVTNVRYTRHVLDSIAITQAKADINGTENFKIFY